MLLLAQVGALMVGWPRRLGAELLTEAGLHWRLADWDRVLLASVTSLLAACPSAVPDPGQFAVVNADTAPGDASGVAGGEPEPAADDTTAQAGDTPARAGDTLTDASTGADGEVAADTGTPSDSSGCAGPADTVATAVPWATAIAAGGRHTCAIRADASATCWGYNASGQLGIGTGSKGTGGAEKLPQAVIALSKVTTLEVGDNFTCALHSGGPGGSPAACWGSRFSGQTGNGDNSGDALVPETVLGLTDAVQLALGTQNAMVVKKDKSLWGWGANYGGQLQQGNLQNQNSPVLVPTLSGASQLCAGDRHVCALILPAGKVWCWGRSPDGQVANGKIGDNSGLYNPAEVANLPPVVAIGCGDQHTCAFDSDGKTWCWGKNLSSELGIGGTSEGVAQPAPVKGLTDTLAVAAGQSHTCAVRKTGAVVCWGDNDEGEAGQSVLGKDVLAPASVVLPALALGVACGRDHSCALVQGGAVWCWGRNSEGQLGNGALIGGSAPGVVSGSSAGQ